MTDSYYDIESTVYSKKRYEGRPRTYVQYFFQNRLAIVLRLLEKIVADRKALALIDIGCADGVITRAVAKRFENNFDLLSGTDISEPMVEVARKATTDRRIKFYSKAEMESMPLLKIYDIALGLGYISPKIYEGEVTFLRKFLKEGGYYICTLAAKDSIHARLKLKNAPYRQEYDTYANYRKMLEKHFEIMKEVPNSIFVPKLWSVPLLGRILQPVFNALFAPFFDNLFHEKVYLLKLRGYK